MTTRQIQQACLYKRRRSDERHAATGGMLQSRWGAGEPALCEYTTAYLQIAYGQPLPAPENSRSATREALIEG